MPTEYVYTEVEGQKLRLSNLDKLIYPDSKIIKANVIQYYLDVAEHLLRFIKDRPLTLIRFPDGITGDRFYAKQKPDWTPDWISDFQISHSKEAINYILAKKKADIAWLANLSALEIHPMQFTSKAEDSPDYFVIDLDPPADSDFGIVKNIAFLLKDFLEEFGYRPFVKTSGSKGLHILVPIKKLYDHETMVASVKKLANDFMKRQADKVTLHLIKNKRQNKVLLDIFRNHKSHTTVAPLSLRGKETAPISMPISWTQLESINDSKFFTITNYKEHLDTCLQSWSNFEQASVELHDQRYVDPERKIVIDQKLESYFEKRNFEDTPEPKNDLFSNENKRYVIQLHNASTLHYDLRLEEEGVLKSWAIPKGLPRDNKTKRLAIQTEDHPVSYLHFEGIIPKNNYGAGNMWIYEQGVYTILKKKASSYKFELSNTHGKRSYHLYHTGDDNWLIELISDDDQYWYPEDPISPMLAESTDKMAYGQVDYEIKWDGIRALFYMRGNELKVISRNLNDLSDKFPELQKIKDYIKIEDGIFDGEIVSLDETGKPVFSQVISRMHSSGSKNINMKSISNPVVAYLFDCLQYDGMDIRGLELHKRRSWLKAAFKKQETYRLSESFNDGEALMSAVKEMGLEGIMIKDKASKYLSGRRSQNWLKYKIRQTEECIILGYTKGKGDRIELFGSLHLAQLVDDQLVYRGRVGSGFNATQMSELLLIFNDYLSDQKPIEEKVEQEKDTTWLKAILICEISYASKTNNETFREAIFVKLRLDKSKL